MQFDYKQVKSLESLYSELESGMVNKNALAKSIDENPITVSKWMNYLGVVGLIKIHDSSPELYYIEKSTETDVVSSLLKSDCFVFIDKKELDKIKKIQLEKDQLINDLRKEIKILTQERDNLNRDIESLKTTGKTFTQKVSEALAH